MNKLNIKINVPERAVDLFGLIDALETELYREITSLPKQCYMLDLRTKWVGFQRSEYDMSLTALYAIPETHDQFVGGV
jgi:hypothetical protein